MTIHSDIDNLFKEGLSDYSQRPPGFVWDNIEQELNKTRFKRRRNVMYAMAASVALLLSFGAGVLFNNTDKQNTLVAEVQNPVIESNTMNNNTAVDITSDNAAESKPEVKKSVKKTENKNQPISTTINSDKKVKSAEEKNIDKNKTERVEPKSKIKKSSSEGVLLPPMFASEADFQNSSIEQKSVVIRESELLEEIEKQKIQLAIALEERDLKYEYREVPMYTDYNNVETEKDYSSWSVGINASPLVSYREVSNVEKETLTAADITSNYEQKYQNEKPLVSYSAGVDVNYNITKRLKVQSGIYFSELGQVSENVDIYKSSSFYNQGDQYYAINTSMGNVNVKGSQNELVEQFGTNTAQDTEIPVFGNKGPEFERSPDLQTNFVQTFEYYEIPLILNYRVVDRKLGVNMAGGISTNILYKNSTYVQDEETRYALEAESEDVNDIGYSGIIGLGFDYPLLSKLFLNLQPTFRYSLSSLNQNNEVHPYSFGVYTGLRYNF